MTAYVVRNVKTKSLLGLFVASSLDNLWDAVDEVTDPFGYEFGVLKNGSMYYEGKEPLPEPDGLTEDQSADHWEKQADCSATYSEHVDDRWNSEKRWSAFDESLVGHGLIARVAVERYEAGCEAGCETLHSAMVALAKAEIAKRDRHG